MMKKINPLIWKGQCIPDCESRMTFARQDVPTSFQCGLWRCLLARQLLHPAANVSALRLYQSLGSWTAESTMRWGAMNRHSTLYRRNPSLACGDLDAGWYISVHHPRVDEIYYNSKPDWYSATIPAQATPTDLTGVDTFHVTSAPCSFALIRPPSTSFQRWLQQLRPAERGLVADHTFTECNAAEQVLLQYLQIPCTLLVGTDGSKKYHDQSLSWICAPRAKSSSSWTPALLMGAQMSRVTAPYAVVLRLRLSHHLLITWTNWRHTTRFWSAANSDYVNSTAASIISNLKRPDPKATVPNHANILSYMSSAHYVIKKFVFTHIHNHQDMDTKFEDFPFPVQFNVLWNRMATARLGKQRMDGEVNALSSPFQPRTLPLKSAIVRRWSLLTTLLDSERPSLPSPIGNPYNQVQMDGSSLGQCRTGGNLFMRSKTCNWPPGHEVTKW